MKRIKLVLKDGSVVVALRLDRCSNDCPLHSIVDSRKSECLGVVPHGEIYGIEWNYENYPSFCPLEDDD